MRPIFNEKVAEKWNLWVHEQLHDVHWLAEKSKKSQTLQLLFMHTLCMNNSRKSHKRVKKKKKKKKTQTQTQTWFLKVALMCSLMAHINQTQYTNRSLRWKNKW